MLVSVRTRILQSSDSSAGLFTQSVALIACTKMAFPVCEHSYTERDKNFAVLNQRADAEMRADWWKELGATREKPPPFIAIKCEQNLLKRVNDYLIFEKRF